jgi:adenylate cyclase class 2
LRYIEVEKKFAVPDTEALRAKLRELGAEQRAATRQVDAYYNAPHRDFLAPEAISEWLRIRTEDGGSSINYKRWLPVDRIEKTHADEYESKVDDIEAIRRLLQMLDFQVVHAGDFVEFEYKGNAETVEEATAQLDEFIASLDVDLGERITRGYPHMLLGRQH